MARIEIDHIPSQTETDSYADNDVVLVYDKNNPTASSEDPQKIIYPVTHAYVVRTVTRKSLVPVEELNFVKSSPNGGDKALHTVTKLLVEGESDPSFLGVVHKRKNSMNPES